MKGSQNTRSFLCFEQIVAAVEVTAQDRDHGMMG
jgi:hypothetical protein